MNSIGSYFRRRKYVPCATSLATFAPMRTKVGVPSCSLIISEQSSILPSDRRNVLKPMKISSMKLLGYLDLCEEVGYFYLDLLFVFRYLRLRLQDSFIYL